MPLCVLGNDHVAESLAFVVLLGIVIYLIHNAKEIARVITLKTIVLTRCLYTSFYVFHNKWRLGNNTKLNILRL